MDEIKFYEFLLKLNTYLQRSSVLADKFARQEKELGDEILNVKNTIPQDVFNALFVPIENLFEKRLKLMDEMIEANNGFKDSLQEYHEYFKGVVQ